MEDLQQPNPNSVVETFTTDNTEERTNPLGRVRNHILMTSYGPVFERQPYEPAPLNCEKCQRLTMHHYLKTELGRNLEGVLWSLHDTYKCVKCAWERRWG